MIVAILVRKCAISCNRCAAEDSIFSSKFLYMKSRSLRLFNDRTHPIRDKINGYGPFATLDANRSNLACKKAQKYKHRSF